MSAKGDVSGLPALKGRQPWSHSWTSQQAEGLKLELCGTRGLAATLACRVPGALSPALPRASALNQVIKLSQVQRSPLPIHKPKCFRVAQRGHWRCGAAHSAVV